MFAPNVNSPLYSQMAGKLKFPSKNQGIVFDSIEGATMEDYLNAIAKKTQPSNVIAASRITQNRFSFFVKTATLVDELTQEENNTIEILGKTVEMRPYIAKLKRVLFSNVLPFIPHDVIVDKLKEFGVVIKTSLTSVRVGTDKSIWAHLLSYRRQMFFEPDDVEKIPADFTVTYDGVSHHIYATTDKMKCFICKLEGHTSKFCPKNRIQDEQLDKNKESNLNTDAIRSIYTASQLSNISQETDANKTASDEENTYRNVNKPKTVTPERNEPPAHKFNDQKLFTKPSTVITRNASKRALSVSSHATDTELNVSTNKKIPATTITPHISKKLKDEKKYKQLTYEIIKEQIEMIQKIYEKENKEQSIVPFANVLEFLTETLNHKLADIPELVEKYSDSPIAMYELIASIRQLTNITSFKTRLTKIKTQIKKHYQLKFEYEEDSTASSQCEFHSDADVTV